MSVAVRALQAWRPGLLASMMLFSQAGLVFGQTYSLGVSPNSMQCGHYAYPGRCGCPAPPLCPSPALPGQPSPTVPPATDDELGLTPVPEEPVVTQAAPDTALAAGFTQSIGGGGGVSVPVNSYIDPAQVFTHFRLRFDAAFDNPIPDRAEFFYAKCGCFANPQLAGNLLDPEAAGPPLPETGVDYQDIRGYLELAVTPNVSGFVEVPFRFIDPEVNTDEEGIADILAGAKAVLLTNGEDYITFQLTTYIPSGDAFEGLGTDHWSIEPGILLYEQWTDRLAFYGETRYWIPIDGSDFAGDILRYGVGTGYDIYATRGGYERVTALAELVAWSILDGAFFDGNNPGLGVQDASGDTILNLKLGMRYTLGDGSFAASWGHGISDEIWYEDIARFEYRRAF